MSNDTVTCLAEDASGTLWIGTDGGVLKYEHDEFTAGTPVGALPDGPVRSLYVTRAGAVWLIMNTAFVRIQGGELASFSPKDVPRLKPFSFVHEDESGAIWVAGPDRLFRFDEGAHQFVEDQLPGSPSQPSLCLFSRSHSGKVWVTTRDGLHERDAVHWSHYGRSAGLSAEITLLFEDRTGALWMALHNGEVLRFSAGQASRLELPQIQGSTVNAIRDDREGNVWIASDAGLLRLTPTQVRTFTRRDGLEDNTVWSVSEARNGGVWAGTRQGLNWLRDDAVVAHTIDPSLGTSTAIRAVVEDASGTVWLGRSGNRLPPHSPVLLFRDGHFRNSRLGSRPITGVGRFFSIAPIGCGWPRRMEWCAGATAF
jgi:ligand-binding sensor domain-containing protein